MEREGQPLVANISLISKQLEAFQRLTETDWLIVSHDINPTVAARLHALRLVKRRIFRPEGYTGGWCVPTCYRITERGKQVLAADLEARMRPSR